jgi:hypothetical protein
MGGEIDIFKLNHSFHYQLCNRDNKLELERIASDRQTLEPEGHSSSEPICIEGSEKGYTPQYIIPSTDLHVDQA